MQQIYDNSKITNLEVTPYIKICLNNLKRVTTTYARNIRRCVWCYIDREIDDVMCSLINCECNESEMLTCYFIKAFGRHDIGNRKTAQ